MNDYDILLATFTHLQVKFSANASVEFVQGGMRRVLWITVPTPIGFLGFKFDTYGAYEGMWKMVQRDGGEVDNSHYV